METSVLQQHRPRPTTGMHVRIHRGATEIGGNCVEVRYRGATILLDLGRPLSAAQGDRVPLPPAIGLSQRSGPLPLAVLLTHGHQDHWGLVPDLPDGIPVWIGEGAADVLRAAQFWGPGIDLAEAGHLRDRQPVQIGPFTITPYLADHSGFDAYSLLVEAGGQRVFYSGDLRGHGRKARAFERLLDDPPTGVGAMLLEGTNLRRGDLPGDAAHQATEFEVEASLLDTIRPTHGLVVVLASPQNIDRLVSVYRAVKRSGRQLALDLYSAEVAAATGRRTIPKVGPDWPLVSAYLPLRQRIRVKQTGQFHRAQAVRPHRVFDEQLLAHRSNWVLFGSLQSHVGHLLGSGLLGSGTVVWSMWDGYLEEPRGRRLVAQLADAGVPLALHHTSGHASAADLARLTGAVGPEVIVPIHSESPQAYAAALGGKVAVHPDGEWWDVPTRVA